MRLLALVLLIPGFYALLCYECVADGKNVCNGGGGWFFEKIMAMGNSTVRCKAGERCVWWWKEQNPRAEPDRKRDCGAMGPHRCGYSESDDEDVGKIWWCACDKDLCNTGSLDELKATVAAYSPTPSPSPPRPVSPVAVDCLYCASNFTEPPRSPLLPGCREGGKEWSRQTTHEKGRCGVPGQYCQMNVKFHDDPTSPPLIERFCVEGEDPKCTVHREDDGFMMGCGCEGPLCNDWDEITLKDMAEATLEPREDVLNMSSPLPVVSIGTTYHIFPYYLFIFLLAFA